MNKKIFFTMLTVLSLVLATYFLRIYKTRDNDTTQAASNVTSELQSIELLDNQTNNDKADLKTICLDPGHGGKDQGASYGKIIESQINFEVASRVKSLLEENGYAVYLTRTDDTFIVKKDRAEYCNSINADIMVSIHHNSYESDSSVNYSTALYYKESDNLLANSILSSVSNSIEAQDQGVSKFNNSLLWTANMPATLIEGFFITNNTKYSELQQTNSKLLENEAQGIFNGINIYFKNPSEIVISNNNDSLYIDRTDLEEQ